MSTLTIPLKTRIQGRQVFLSEMEEIKGSYGGSKKPDNQNSFYFYPNVMAVFDIWEGELRYLFTTHRSTLKSRLQEKYDFITK